MSFLARKNLAALLAFGLLQPLAACKSNAPGAQTSSAGLAVETISMKTTDGKTIPLTLEIARSSEEQAKGLKYRDAIKPQHGMLFPLDPPRTASFWMQDTVISLDMMFIRTDGSVSTIQADTVPLSRKPVGSDEPVAAVLELGGGEAARLGISPGAKLLWREFNQ
jgi:uncharacterized protein